MGEDGGFAEHRGALPMSAGASRTLARRAWYGRAPAPAALGWRAEELAASVPPLPGRVQPLGRFEDPAVWQALSVCLPPEAGKSLRRTFEWYGCRGAGFHTDAHYDSVLFGAWCLAGPARDVVFGQRGLRLACTAGDLVMFDPFQPHAVLDSGESCYDRERYAGAPANVFLGFEVELSDPVRELFGIGPAEPGAFAIGSGTAVNAETGVIVR
jgi:hypothetical protein